MKLQKLLSYTRQAVDDYRMIEAGDRIAVGISGGKDSLALLCALSRLRAFYPREFELQAVTVDLGYNGFDLHPILSMCEKLEVSCRIVPTEIASIVNRKIPEGASRCPLCAKMRKGALNDAALALGCNKVAYAHHMDDIIETAFLSLIYEGRFYAFPPVTRLEHTGLTVIRPLLYASEAEIKGFQNKYRLPVVKNPCPVDGTTRREYVKHLLGQMNRETPGVKKRLFRAIVHGNITGWPQISQ